MSCVTCVALLQMSCATQTTTTSSGVHVMGQGRQSDATMSQEKQAQLADLVADGDVNDPTAAALHDLAGKLLMYKAIYRKLPGKLAEMAGDRQGSGGALAKQLLDPISGRPFVYTPDSSRHPMLPGRIILYQPSSQGMVGRWALLFNDQDKNGDVITYVQRVPDSLLPKDKNSTQITH